MQSTHNLYHIPERATTSIRSEIRLLVTEFESLELTYNLCKDNKYLLPWIKISVMPAVSNKLTTMEELDIITTTPAELDAVGHISAIIGRITGHATPRRNVDIKQLLLIVQSAGR